MFVTLQVSIRCNFLLAATIALVRFGHIMRVAPANIMLHSFHYIITKTRLYNFDPLKPQFYIVKLGFT